MRAKHLFLIAICTSILASIAQGAELTDAVLKRMRSEKRAALVIGNGDYKNFEALDNPVNDATGVAAALRDAGFEVILKTNATRNDIMASLDQFSEVLSRADVALFYFAGHAAQVDWHNYILPVAAKLEVKKGGAVSQLTSQVAQEAIDLDDVLKRLEAAEKKLNIVILDACRDNPFTAKALEATRTRSAGSAPIPVSAGLAPPSAPPRTFVAYSTAPGQVASDGVGKNSPYSGALIKALKVPDLKLEDVFKRVRNDVATATQFEQIPWDNSSVFDDFFFRIPSSVAAAEKAAKKGQQNTTFIPP
jgi:uncharacterized caspase-like protein